MKTAPKCPKCGQIPPSVWDDDFNLDDLDICPSCGASLEYMEGPIGDKIKGKNNN